MCGLAPRSLSAGDRPTERGKSLPRVMFAICICACHVFSHTRNWTVDCDDRRPTAPTKRRRDAAFNAARHRHAAPVVYSADGPSDAARPSPPR